MKAKVTAEEIDALLPQTQCGLCGYNGCMPYAEALAQNAAAINLCPPGGVKGLLALGNFLNVDPAPYIADMEKTAKPKLLAVIREAECIGCTKCIKACPVDAILGGAKQMHTVIADECTGCELCIAPCPVDCIDMVPVTEEENKADYYRERYLARQKRLTQDVETPTQVVAAKELTDKQAYIQAALERIKNKKSI